MQERENPYVQHRGVSESEYASARERATNQNNKHHTHQQHSTTISRVDPGNTINATNVRSSLIDKTTNEHEINV